MRGMIAVRETSGEYSPTLRKHQTDAERKLWFRLRDRRSNGAKFRRQYPVGPFVTDFACLEMGLVIEVDGGQHTDSVSDKKRDRWFSDNDFVVLRYWNNDILKNLEGVLTSLLERLQSPRNSAR